MSELIDRQALLDSVYKNLPMIPSMAGMTAEEMRLRIAVLIENAPTVSPWHRVEDGLPRGQELVIVAVKDTAGDTPFWYTQCGWVTTDGEYWIVENDICNYVVAWMPLPEPPGE